MRDPAPSDEPLLLVRTGVANIASVLAALDRLGVSHQLVEDPTLVRDAARVILPGVGAFGAGVARLEALGLGEALRARVEEERPTLAICLGLQLLCASSEETPGARGLGLIDAHVTRFSADTGVRIPQLGWNRITPSPDCRLLEEGYAYFANSFKLDAVPDGWAGATAEHGAPFVAAIERGAVLACQFHPELSGPWGAALLQRWLNAS